MVDEVISGGQQIASEATLQRLVDLMAGAGGAGGGSADKLKDLAAKAGVAGDSVTATGGKLKALIPGLVNFGQGLVNGSSSASQLAGLFTVLGGNVGLAAAVISKLIAIQEQNFAEYQKMSSAGANFGGSLTDLRLAAMNSYVTLEQFGRIVRENRQTLSRMGGSVNDGAMSFAVLSNQLIKNDAGSKLLALGYTTEELNDGMLKYIATTGGRTKDELRNTTAITEATTSYLTELDKVTQFTGVNRKAMEEEQKKAAAQAAFQRKMQSLNEADRAKLQAAYDAAAASKMAGATDAVMSVALGMPPLTKEAQQFAGTLPEAYQGLISMTDTAMKAGTTMDDVRQANGKFVMGAVHGAEQLGRTGDALSLQNNATVTGAIALQNQMNAKGIKTADQYAKAYKDIGDNQGKQAKSQAATMADVQKTLSELGATVMTILTPAINALMFPLGLLFDTISFLLKPIAELAEGMVAFSDRSLKPLMGAVHGITDSFKNMWAKVMASLEPVIAPFRKLFDTNTGNLGKFFGVMYDIVGFLIAAPFKMLFGAIGIQADLLSGVFSVLGTVVSAVLTPFQMLADAVSSTFDFLSAEVDKLSGWLDPSTWFGKNESPRKKMADGGIVNRPTRVLAGEAGSEAIIPLAKFENIIQSFIKPKTSDEINNIASGLGNSPSSNGSQEVLSAGLDQLNKNVLEMIRTVKDVAENTKRTFEATRSLNGDHFA